MSEQSASQEVTKAIASTKTADLNRMVDAANSSKEKRRQLAEEKARKEEDEQKAKEAAVRVLQSMYTEVDVC